MNGGVSDKKEENCKAENPYGGKPNTGITLPPYIGRRPRCIE